MADKGGKVPALAGTNECVIPRWRFPKPSRREVLTEAMHVIRCNMEALSGANRFDSGAVLTESVAALKKLQKAYLETLRKR